MPPSDRSRPALAFYLERKLIHDGDAFDAPHFLLATAHGPDPAVDPDLALHVLDLVVQPLPLDGFEVVVGAQLLVLRIQLPDLVREQRLPVVVLVQHLVHFGLQVLVFLFERLHLLGVLVHLLGE